jgi:hypothetical protein
MTTRTFQFTVASSSVPTWTQDSVNNWVEIPGTTLLPTMVAPANATEGNNPSRFFAYSGGAIHPTTLQYFAIGGGHDDYAGNDVYSISLAVQNPSWTRRSTATPAVGGSFYADGTTTSTGNGYAYYHDGRPSSRHTWSGAPQVIPTLGAQGQLVTFGADSVFGSGNGRFKNVDAWDIATNDYSWINPSPLANPNGPNPLLPMQTGAGSSCLAALKDARGDVWAFFQSNGTTVVASRWTASTQTWGTNVAMNRISVAQCYDSLRDRIFMFPYGGANTGQYFSALDGSGFTYFSWGANPPPTPSGTAYYEPNLDKYVFLPQGYNDLWLVDPVTFASTQVVTTGTKPTIGGGGLAGANTRLVYIPQYKGLAFFPTIDQNAFFIRTS